MAGRIRVGIGGWTFPPWRGEFYPEGLRQKDELAYASRHLTAIEINGTYHSLQTPESFAKWAHETPDDFVFTVKGSMFCANRRVLAEAGRGLERFFAQGLDELGDRSSDRSCGSSWPPRSSSRRFRRLSSTCCRQSWRSGACGIASKSATTAFADRRFVDMCRERGVAICLSEHESWPLIAG